MWRSRWKQDEREQTAVEKREKRGERRDHSAEVGHQMDREGGQKQSSESAYIVVLALLSLLEVVLVGLQLDNQVPQLGGLLLQLVDG